MNCGEEANIAGPCRYHVKPLTVEVQNINDKQKIVKENLDYHIKEVMKEELGSCRPLLNGPIQSLNMKLVRFELTGPMSVIEKVKLRFLEEPDIKELQEKKEISVRQSCCKSNFCKAEATHVSAKIVQRIETKKTENKDLAGKVLYLQCTLNSLQEGKDLNSVTLLDHVGKPVLRKTYVSTREAKAVEDSSNDETKNREMKQIQGSLMDKISARDIVIAHNGDSDLKVLCLDHPLVVDAIQFKRKKQLLEAKTILNNIKNVNKCEKCPCRCGEDQESFGSECTCTPCDLCEIEGEISNENISDLGVNLSELLKVPQIQIDLGGLKKNRNYSDPLEDVENMLEEDWNFQSVWEQSINVEQTREPVVQNNVLNEDEQQREKANGAEDYVYESIR